MPATQLTTSSTTLQKGGPKRKASKTLPSTRISFSKQLDILRAYAIASEHGNKSVANAEVAKLVQMVPSTVSLSNAFFLSVGLIQKMNGGYTPAPEVVSFGRAHEWNPEKAAYKLSPLLSKSWFAEALLPKVRFRPIDQGEAIEILGEAAQADKKYIAELDTLIDYLERCGLVARNGNLIQASQDANADISQPPATGQPDKEKKESIKTQTGMGLGFFSPTEGVVQFHVSVKVDMKELSRWEAERITAFFGGIAQVLAAKGKLEGQEE